MFGRPSRRCALRASLLRTRVLLVATLTGHSLRPHPEEPARPSARVSRRMAKSINLALGPSFETPGRCEAGLLRTRAPEHKSG